MADGPRSPAGAEGRSANGDDGAEAREVRSRLEVLQEAARAFAHDFKNPLSAMLLGVQRLARLAEPHQSPHARALAARLEGTVHAMDLLVDGLADLARHQSGRLQLEPSRQPAVEVLTRAVEGLRPGPAERRPGIELEVRGPLPEVEWDAERVIRALHHLVGCARALAAEGTSVRCTAEHSGAHVVVTVVAGAADAEAGPVAGGAGLAPAHRTRELAVTFARALAEAHGGSLEVEDPPGGAPVYRLVLPVSAAASRAAPDRHPPGRAAY